MKQGNSRSHRAALALTVVGALLRLAPHPPNFAPIGATGLFSGTRLRGWEAYLVPLVAMLVTDPIRSAMEGQYPAYSAMTVIVYASMLVYVFLGQKLLAGSKSAGRIALVCLAGSTQFFLITNFFAWLGPEMGYPHTMAGLLACYTAALPFFERTVLGDLFFTAVLTGAYYFIVRRSQSQDESPEAAGAALR